MSLKDKPIILVWEQVDAEMREFIWKVLRDTSRTGMDKATTVLISLAELKDSAHRLHRRWLADAEIHTRAGSRYGKRTMANLSEHWEKLTPRQRCLLASRFSLTIPQLVFLDHAKALHHARQLAAFWKDQSGKKYNMPSMGNINRLLAIWEATVAALESSN